MKLKIYLCLFIILQFSCVNKFDNSSLKIFKYNEGNGISTLDPAFAKDKATIWATSQIFNSLVKMDEDLNVVPSISSNWKISQDGLEYIFFLRNDVFSRS